MTREYAEMVATVVVNNGLAVVFSQRIDGDDPDAGKKGRMGWNTADPWPKGNQQGLVAQLLAHWGKRNLLVVTGSSNVVTIDCDTQAGLDLYGSFGLPPTLTIRSGRDGSGYHFVHRPPRGDLEYTFFELAGDESPEVTGAVRNKLHVLAGIHKTGRQYQIAIGPYLTELPLEVYRTLAEGYGLRHRAVREDIPQGKKIAHPGRHDYLVQRASDYLYLGHRGAALAAHLRVDWEYGCEQEPRKEDIDAEIAGIVEYAEQRWVGQ